MKCLKFLIKEKLLTLTSASFFYTTIILVEKSLTGNRLEGVASLIAKEVTEYLLDDGLRSAYAKKGKLQFQIDPEDLAVVECGDAIQRVRRHPQQSGDGAKARIRYPATVLLDNHQRIDRRRFAVWKMCDLCFDFSDFFTR